MVGNRSRGFLRVPNGPTNGQLLPVAEGTDLRWRRGEAERIGADRGGNWILDRVATLTQSGQRGRHFVARCMSVPAKVFDVERPASV